MTNLNKSPASAHHHKCPHYVDVHKPQQVRVEPRREIVKDDLTNINQKQHIVVAETCVHLTAGQATGKNGDQVSPSDGSKMAADVVVVPMDNATTAKTSPSVRYV